MDNEAECKGGAMRSDKGHRQPSSVESFAWSDVRCSYADKLGGEKEVLHGVSGYLQGGEMLAVIGPSGCGKTCLMDVLAGRKTVGRVTSTRLLNGVSVDEHTLTRMSVYMSQDDVFHPTCTVNEAIMFHAHLRLGPGVSVEEKRGKVTHLLEDVGLHDKGERYVGGELPGGMNLRGLSGGEKRRLSLCCATITEPGLLFLDEPTSGLDSLSALVVMKQLKRYCDRGVTIMCTIHQPRFAIWALFEKVLVLSSGYELYFGPLSKAEWWFSEELGYPRPNDASAADYLLDVVNTDFHHKAQPQQEQQHHPASMEGEEDLRQAAARFQASLLFKHAMGGSMSGSAPPAQSHHSPIFHFHLKSSPNLSLSQGLGLWFWEFKVLLRRFCLTYVRNPGNLLARLVVVCFLAAVQIALFYGTGAKSSVFNGPAINILGALFTTLVNCSMTPFNSITMFIFDRHFLLRESADGLYSISAYYLAYTLLEGTVCTVFAILTSALVYPAQDFAALHPSWPGNFARYLAIVTVQMIVGNQIAIFWSLLSPNQDIARALMSGYVALSLCAAGFVVPRPTMSEWAKPMMYISDMHYSLQAMIINMFRDTEQEPYIALLGFDRPSSIATNLLCSAGFYMTALGGGYLCLRLHKERR